MKLHDLGCGAGAGMDNKDVLKVSVVSVNVSHYMSYAVIFKLILSDLARRSCCDDKHQQS